MPDAPMPASQNLWNNYGSVVKHTEDRENYVRFRLSEEGKAFVFEVREERRYFQDGNEFHTTDATVLQNSITFSGFIDMVTNDFFGNRPYDSGEYLMQHYTADELDDFLKRMRSAREALEKIIVAAHKDIDTISNTLNEVYALKLEGFKPRSMSGKDNFWDDIPF